MRCTALLAKPVIDPLWHAGRQWDDIPLAEHQLRAHNPGIEGTHYRWRWRCGFNTHDDAPFCGNHAWLTGVVAFTWPEDAA